MGAPRVHKTLVQSVDLVAAGANQDLLACDSLGCGCYAHKLDAVVEEEGLPAGQGQAAITTYSAGLQAA